MHFGAVECTTKRLQRETLSALIMPPFLNWSWVSYSTYQKGDTKTEAYSFTEKYS
jgi:hypothetical protein